MNTVPHREQVAQLSQRNSAAGIVSFSRNISGTCPLAVPVINALVLNSFCEGRQC